MTKRDVISLLALAALWGGSFPFQRIAVHEFGPVALVELRIVIGAVVLTPMLFARSGWKSIAANLVPIMVIGVLNSMLPFLLLAYATVSVTAGLVSILNATSPLFGALIAAIWLKERLTWPRTAGLCFGFGAIIFLFQGGAGFNPGGSDLAIPAALAAAFNYGLAANYARRKLVGVPPLLVAAGSLVFAAIILCPLAVWYWPTEPPSAVAWEAVAGLGVGCTGIAYVLYFNLIARVGATNAITVTFIIPMFAMVIGWIFLGERVTDEMVIACGAILTGTALATGIIRLGPKIASPASKPESDRARVDTCSGASERCS